MSYCIYLRKSRADNDYKSENIQETETETLNRHEKTLLKLAKENNLNISKIYKEVVSGETIDARPQMKELIKDVTNCLYKGVLCMEIERLARGNSIDQGIIQQTFKFSNTLIITPNKTYNPADEFDETFMELGLFLSRQEYKTIKRRLLAGRISSINEGKYLGTTPTFGYDRKKLENQKGWTLTINPNEAEVVKLIFKLYTEEKYGVQRIAKYLNDSNIPTKKNSNWANQTVGAVLKNPVYCGKIRWNYLKEVKKVVDGKIITSRKVNKDCMIVNGLHEPIVSEEIFNLANNIRSENYIPRVRNDKELKNPLVGLLKCGMCGKSMIRRPFKKPEPIYMCENHTCKNVSSYCSRVEERLITYLEMLLNEYELDKNANIASLPKYDINSLEILHNKYLTELETYKLQQNKLHDLLEQDIYTVEKFVERNKIISEQINNIENKINEISKKILSEKITQNNPIDLSLEIFNTIEIFKNSSNEQLKNDALKEILHKIVYTKEKGGRWQDPLNFTIKLYPKLPDK